MPARPVIAAHRGGALLWPENSSTAIRNAAALGVEQVEVDVHLAADDVPVVIHDATLDRTTEASGPVRAHPAAVLGRMRLRGTAGETVPTLAEIADLLRPTGCDLRLELKSGPDGRPYPDAVQRCAETLRRCDMLRRTVLIAFAPRTVAAAAAFGFPHTALLLGAIAWRGLDPSLAARFCAAVGTGELGLPFAACDDAATVAAVRGTGLRLGAWGLDQPGALRRGLDLGLDVITTDDPVAALRARG